MGFKTGGYINPIFGTLWMEACLVFVEEISRARNSNTHSLWMGQSSGMVGMSNGMPSHTLVDTNEAVMWTPWLERGMNVMARAASGSVLMDIQLKKVRTAYASISI